MAGTLERYENLTHVLVDVEPLKDFTVGDMQDRDSALVIHILA